MSCEVFFPIGYSLVVPRFFFQMFHVDWIYRKLSRKCFQEIKPAMLNSMIKLVHRPPEHFRKCSAKEPGELADEKVSREPKQGEEAIDKTGDHTG